MSTTKQQQHALLGALSAVTILLAALILTLSLVPGPAAAETPAERCKRETTAYNNAWKNTWAQANPGKSPSDAPPPPVPYKCGGGNDGPPPTLSPTPDDEPDDTTPTTNAPTTTQQRTGPNINTPTERREIENNQGGPVIGSPSTSNNSRPSAGVLTEKPAHKSIPSNTNRTGIESYKKTASDNNNPRVVFEHRGIPEPINYVYNPNLEPKARHDFCTSSPDSGRWYNRQIDFAGPCARHDLCMDEAERRDAGYGVCNRRLGDDMRTQCDNTYSIRDAAVIRKADTADALYSCKANAKAYEAAVSATHRGRNQMDEFPVYCYATNPGEENRRGAPECRAGRK